jgi:hypothetical protein
MPLVVDVRHQFAGRSAARTVAILMYETRRNGESWSAPGSVARPYERGEVARNFRGVRGSLPKTQIFPQCGRERTPSPHRLVAWRIHICSKATKFPSPSRAMPSTPEKKKSGGSNSNGATGGLGAHLAARIGFFPCDCAEKYN